MRDAAAVIDAVRRGATTEVIELDGVKIASVPSDRGRRLESLKKFTDEYRTAPERRAGIARVDDLASFCEHVNRFRDKHSVIFASESGPSLMAVLDYHEAAASGKPRFGGHRTSYEFPVADEWKAWTRASGNSMSQREFAEFLEEHIIDVAAPDSAGPGSKVTLEAISGTLADAARLMALAQGLSINVNRKVKQAVNLSSGEVQVQFDEEHKDGAGATLQVPTAFLLAIPVFRQGDRFQLVARLRYRVKDGDISWTILIHRYDRVLTTAFREAAEAAATKTGLPLFFGRPE